MEIEEQQDAMMQQQFAQSQQGQINQARVIEEQERSMIKEQLDLNDELAMIEHLLKGDVVKITDGIPDWSTPEDKEMIILSDYGIHLIMNTIKFYINKNTLLSNYDEDTILIKMKDFANDLNDTVFMEYEKVFQYPTIEDCKKLLNERIARRIELRIYSLQQRGEKINEEEIGKRIRAEIRDVEIEIEKIKEQLVKNKLKRYMILIRTVQDAVHSTYLRAYQGQERRSLRQHMNITEVRGGSQGGQMPSRVNPFKWGKK